MGGHEVRRLVLRGVVHHEPRAERRAPGGDHADSRNLVPPAVGARANHVNLARAGLVARQLAETAVTDVDRRQLQGQLLLKRARNRDLHDDVVREYRRRPELPVVGVVEIRVRLQRIAPIGGIDPELPAGRHVVGAEPEIQRQRAGRRDAQVPLTRLRVEVLPDPVRRGRNQHVIRDGKPRGLTLALALQVFRPHRGQIRKRYLHLWHGRQAKVGAARRPDGDHRNRYQ